MKMENKIIRYIQKAMEVLWLKQPNLSRAFTNQTLEREANLSFHIANELKLFFREYDCDFDITKTDFENMRPDVIFHKRWTNNRNILVLEIKRLKNHSVRDGICRDDENKIISNWLQSPLRYKFWVSLVVDEQKQKYYFSLIKASPDRNIMRRFKSDTNWDCIEIPIR